MAGMATGRAGLSAAERHARGAARQAAPWVEPAARAGYAAKGAVYVVVGLLAAQAAFGTGGEVTDSRGAMEAVLRQPAGSFLLVLLAVGMFGYAFWRLVTAAVDPENTGETDAKRVAVRVGYLFRAILYGGLGVEAIRLAASGGSSGSGGSDGTEHWTARVLAMPLGQWIVGLAGAGVVAYGLYQLRRAQQGDIRKRLDLSELDGDAERWVIRVGQVGVAARSVVFAMVGWFLIRAAMTSNAEEAGGLGQALAELGSTAYGPWLLGLTAIGLVAYGGWQVVKARYRRIAV